MARRWFLVVTVLLTVAHPLLPDVPREITYLLVSGLTMLPLAALVRRLSRRDGLPWQLLLVAMGLLTGGNVVSACTGPGGAAAAGTTIALGHTLLLAAAVVTVLRRGRNDIGGVLDVSVAAIGIGGLVWTVLLFPRLQVLGVRPGAQVTMLASVLVLVGVLGALVRLWKVSDRPLPALTLFLWALALGLVGNVVLAMATGSMTTGRPGAIEMFFMVSYACVGLAPMHPSAAELSRPGPAPSDRLTTGRLVFLGAALAVMPVAGGVREMAGLEADGPLLALGAVLTVSLVMIRVGRLSGERRRAEARLHHQATHDLLTGLPNRAELLARLQDALDAERTAGQPSVVLLFCDLNGFKEVNDRLGHLAGDRLLTAVGARIGDALGPGETLARYGGDEFLLLCRDTDQAAAALRLTGIVERALASDFDLGGVPVTAGASIGAVISDGGCAADDLITRADQAMYRAKQRRRAARAPDDRAAVRSQR